MPYRFLKEIFFIKGKFLDITVRYEYLKFIQAGALGEVASRIEANVKILTFVSIRGLEGQGSKVPGCNSDRRP